MAAKKPPVPANPNPDSPVVGMYGSHPSTMRGMPQSVIDRLRSQRARDRYMAVKEEADAMVFDENVLKMSAEGRAGDANDPEVVNAKQVDDGDLPRG